VTSEKQTYEAVAVSDDEPLAVQPPLFDGFESKPKPVVRRVPRKPRWSAYRPKNRVSCDDCLSDLVEAGGGPLSRAARWRRVQGESDLLICSAHAQLRRDADGLAPLKDV
jgi:hypothetical protein